MSKSSIQYINERKRKARLAEQRRNAKTNAGGDPLAGLGYVAGKAALDIGYMAEGITDGISAVGHLLVGDTEGAADQFKNNVMGDLGESLDAWYNPSGAMQFVGDVTAGLAQNSVRLLDLVLPGLGTGLYFAGQTGRGISSAAQQTGEVGLSEVAYGASSAALDTMVGLFLSGGASAVKSLGSALGKSGTKALTSVGKSATKAGFKTILKETAKSAAGEFAEEALSEALDPALQRITRVNPNAEAASLSDILYAGAVGAVSGGIMGGGASAINFASTNKTGRTIRESGQVDNLLRRAELVSTALDAEREAYDGQSEQTTKGFVQGVQKRKYRKQSKRTKAHMENLRASIETYRGLSEDSIANGGGDALLGEIRNNTYYATVSVAIDGYEQLARSGSEEAILEYLQEINVDGRSYTVEDFRTNRDLIATEYATRMVVEDLQGYERPQEMTEEPYEDEYTPPTPDDTPMDADELGEMYEEFMSAESEKDVMYDEDYEDEHTSAIRSEISDMKLSADYADMAVDAYRVGGTHGLSATVFAHSYATAVRMAEQGATIESLLKEPMVSRLDDSTLQKAVEMGRKRAGQGNTSTTTKNPSAEGEGEKKNQQQAQPDTSVKPQFSSKVHLPQSVIQSGLSSKQEATVRAAEVLAEVTGVEMYFYTSFKQGEGRAYRDHTGKMVRDAHGKPLSAKGIDGWYAPKENAIHIDLNGGWDSRGVSLFTLAHEVTHFIKEWSPDKFSTLVDFVLRQHATKDGSKTLSTLYAKKEKMLRDRGLLAGKSDEAVRDLVMEEIVADSMETVLKDGRVISDLAKTDKTLWEKIRDFIADMVAKIKRAYKGEVSDHEAGRFMQETLDSLDEMQTLWRDAVLDAGERHKRGDGVSRMNEGNMQVRYTYQGVAEDGRKIYESNFPKGTPKSAKSQRILDYIKNVWSKKPIRLVISNGDTSRVIYAQFDPTIDESQNTPTDASKLAGGNRHGNHTEQRVTLDLADDYYEIASEATYNYSKMETGKTSNPHQGVIMWHYFVNDIYFAEQGSTELVPYTVTINIKEKSNGEFVYSFNAEKESSTRQTLHADVNTHKGANGELFYDDSIPHSDPSVNPKFSLSSETDTAYMDAVSRGDTEEAQRMVDEAAKRAGYTVKAYHGTGADFNIFSEEYMSEHNVWGKGYYFGTSRGIAEDYATWRTQKGGTHRIVSALLKMDHPFIPYQSSIGSAEQILDRWFPDMWQSNRELGVGYIKGKMKGDMVSLLQFIAEHNHLEIRDVLDTYGYDSVQSHGEIVVFSSHQIKSADPVTYDDHGEVIPLSERFDEDSQDIRYSFAEDPTDTAYMDAVNRGDTEEAQRMVDEAAKRAGYTVKAYHGSPNMFNEFSHKLVGTHGTAEGFGFYFTSSRNIAEIYGEKGYVYDVFLSIKKPLSNSRITMTKAQLQRYLLKLNNAIGIAGEKVDILSSFGDTYQFGERQVVREAVELLYDGNDNDVDLFHEIMNVSGDRKTCMEVLRQELGYDGIIEEQPSWGGDQTIYVTFHSDQSKRSDPVTYDDHGEVIPLSERFDEDSQDIRYSFAGESSETADKSLLTRAKEMQSNGVDSESIRQETGWYQGYDGKWRYEIDDSETVFLMGYRDIDHDSTYRLDEVLDAPALYEAYPALASYQIRMVEDMEEGATGSYNLDTKEITLLDRLGEAFDEDGEAELRDEMKSVLLHEIQHAIQDIEGFARGASPSYWENSPYRDESAARRMSDIEYELRYITQHNPAFATLMERADKAVAVIDEIEERYAQDTMPDSEVQRMNYAMERYETLMQEAETTFGVDLVRDYVRLKAEMLDLSHKPHRTAEDLYRSTAGEVEARDVSNRQGLTATQRKNTRPDIDRTDVVFASSYQVSYEFDEKFGRQLRDWQEGNGKKNGSYNGSFFRLGTTPQILVKHGASPGEVIMFEDCLLKITGLKHSISLDELAKIPSQLNDPILLFRGSVANSFVALTEIKDKNGHDVLVIVHINKKMGRSVISKIASVYSKTDDSGSNRIVNYVLQQIRQGNLLDASVKKAPTWFTASGLQLPHAVQTIIDAYNSSLSQTTPKVNPKFSLSENSQNFADIPPEWEMPADYESDPYFSNGMSYADEEEARLSSAQESTRVEFTQNSMNALVKKIMDVAGLNPQGVRRAKIPLMQDLTALYGRMATDSKFTHQDMVRFAKKIAVDLYARNPGELVIEEGSSDGDLYRSVLQYFKEHPFTLSEAQKAELAYLNDGSYGNYYKRNQGNLKIRNQGTPLDALWQEICDLFPSFFSPDTNAMDMAVEVERVTSMARSRLTERYDPNAEYADSIISATAKAIYDGYKEVNVSKRIVIPKDATTVQSEIQQEVEDGTLTDRDVMLYMAETMVRTQADYEIVQNYREQLEVQKARQEEVDSLRARVEALQNTLYTDPDPAKRSEAAKALSGLYQEISALTEDIATLDRELARIEGMKAIRNLMLRERKNAREFFREQFTRRERINTEKRQMTELGVKTRRVIGRLHTMFFNATKTRHVPADLRDLVEQALNMELADFATLRKNLRKMAELEADIEALEKKPTLTSKEQYRLDKLLEEYAELAGLVISPQKQAQALFKAFKKYQADAKAKNHRGFDEDMMEFLEEQMDAMEDKPLSEMSIASQQAVWSFYKELYHQINTYNKLFTDERNATLEGEARSIMQEMMETKAPAWVTPKKGEPAVISSMRKYLWALLKPVNFFDMLGSKTFTKAFMDLHRGMGVYARDAEEARLKFAELSKKHGFEGWDLNQRFEVETSNGKRVKISLGQIMSIYAYSRREQALDHLEFGGFTFAPNATYKGKYGDEGAIKRFAKELDLAINDAERYTLDAPALGKIISRLTEEQKAFVEAMQDYLSVDMARKGNMVSRALYDMDLFGEEYYFPIRSAKEYIDSETGKVGDPKVKNKGMTQRVKPGADNPLILGDFMEVWTGHITDMALYHGMVLPMENLNRLLNYRPGMTFDEEGNPQQSDIDKFSTMKELIRAKYGIEAVSYIEQLLRDLNGGVRSGAPMGLVDKGLSLFKKSAVMASASVVIQQPSSIARAMALIDSKYFAHLAGFNFKDSRGMWDELKKYAPVAIIKEMGGFDTGVGQTTADYIMAREYNGVKKKLGALKNDPAYRDSVLGYGAAKADQMAWLHLWEAVKLETADRHRGMDVKSEEFLKLAGERFEEVIIRTQVYDSTLSRSGMMRSKDTGWKMVTAFMAEPTTVANMLTSGFVALQRGDKKGFRRTVASVSAALVLNAVLASIVYAARDDDEEKNYGEKYVSTLVEETADAFNPLATLPYVKDIMSLVQGYEVERSDMAVYADLINTINGMGSSEKSWMEKSVDLGANIGTLFGLPTRNIQRDARGIYNVLSNAGGDGSTSRGMSVAVQESLRSMVPFGKVFGIKTDISNGYQLYDAMVSGDTAHESRVLSRFETKSAANTALRTALRDKDARIRRAAQARYEGDMATYSTLVREVKTEGIFSQDMIVSAINAEMNAIKKDYESGAEDNADPDATPEEVVEGSVYAVSDLNSQLDAGDFTEAKAILVDMVNARMAQGKTKKQAQALVKSGITRYWKEKYLTAYKAKNTAECKRIRTLLKQTGLYGTASEILEVTQSWVKS